MFQGEKQAVHLTLNGVSQFVLFILIKPLCLGRSVMGKIWHLKTQLICGVKSGSKATRTYMGRKMLVSQLLAHNGWRVRWTQ